MAEIVKLTSMKSTRLFSRRVPGTEQVELRDRVIVRSIRSDRMDVSVLRDLVAALDEAQVPDRAQVQHQVSGAVLTQLIVEAEIEQPVAPEIAAGPAGGEG